MNSIVKELNVETGENMLHDTSEEYLNNIVKEVNVEAGENVLHDTGEETVPA